MNCPSCGARLLRGAVDGVDSWACVSRGCGFIRAIEPQCAVQTKLLDPGPRRNRLHWTEAATEEAIRQGCAQRGWTVLTTSRRRRMHRCSRCGHVEWPRGGDGCSPGLPDRLVHVRGALWVGIEAKGSRTALSAEQRALYEAGMIRLARTWQEFEQAVQEAREEGDRDRDTA